MSFADRLKQKMRVDKLAKMATASLSDQASGGRLDRDSMRELLAMTPLRKTQARDLELWLRDLPDGRKDILVLDNELPVYPHTTVDQVLILKSPTVKEMVHNVFKILYYSKDTVKTRRTDTVAAIHKEIVDAIDLSFTMADIEEMADQAREALTGRNVKNILSYMSLFGSLLGYHKSPIPLFDPALVEVMGLFRPGKAKSTIMGPAVFYRKGDNRMMWLEKAVDLSDVEKREALSAIALGDAPADAEQDQAVERLAGAVIAKFGLSPGKRADVKDGKAVLMQ
ncbi:MAG: hypothetical protein AB1921_02975 [Thermodesulfobacteriota bacterium]